MPVIFKLRKPLELQVPSRKGNSGWSNKACKVIILEAYENNVGNCVSKSNQKFVKEQRADGDRLSGGKYLIGGFLVDLINAITTNLRYVLTKWEITHQNRIHSKQKNIFFIYLRG